MLSATPVTPAPTRRPPRTDYEALVEKIDVLEEKLRQARDELVPQRVFPARWRLTRQQQQVLSFLLARAPSPRSGDQIISALNAAGYRAESEKLPDVVICNLRKRLRPEGLLIHTFPTVGYALDKATADRIVDLCARAAQGEDTFVDQSVVILGSAYPRSHEIIEHHGVIRGPDQLRDLLKLLADEGVKRWPHMARFDGDETLRSLI